MEETIIEICKNCGKRTEEVGVRSQGTGEALVLCVACLNAMYPEGKEMPAEMDKDGNLYFIDKRNNEMIILFAYGDVPYSSYTKVSLEEEDVCGFY